MLGWGIDRLLPVMTICLQSERAIEIERVGRRMLRNTVESRQDDGGRRDCGMESSRCSIYSGYGWGSCRGCTACRRSSTSAQSVLMASVVTTWCHYTEYTSLTIPYHSLCCLLYTCALVSHIFKPLIYIIIYLFLFFSPFFCFRITHTHSST